MGQSVMKPGRDFMVFKGLVVTPVTHIIARHLQFSGCLIVLGKINISKTAQIL